VLSSIRRIDGETIELRVVLFVSQRRASIRIAYIIKSDPEKKKETKRRQQR
jgi:hypothetical protein